MWKPSRQLTQYALGALAASVVAGGCVKVFDHVAWSQDAQSYFNAGRLVGYTMGQCDTLKKVLDETPEWRTPNNVKVVLDCLALEDKDRDKLDHVGDHVPW